MKPARQVVLCALGVGVAALLVCSRLCVALFAIKLAYLSRTWPMTSIEVGGAIMIVWIGMKAWKRADLKLALLFAILLLCVGLVAAVDIAMLSRKKIGEAAAPGVAAD